MNARAGAIYDQLLLLRCRRGDNDAWRELVARWQRPLVYYIRRLVSREDDAWDILQQTWMAVLKGLPKLRETERFSVWLHRIARNLALSHRRRDKPIDPLPDAAVATEMRDPSEDAMALDDAHQVHAALDRISLAHREVLTLFFLADLSLEQIAEVIEVPIGTIKSRLHHARRALREVMDGGTEP